MDNEGNTNWIASDDPEQASYSSIAKKGSLPFFPGSKGTVPANEDVPLE
jgi:hypothetical protein